MGVHWPRWTHRLRRRESSSMRVPEQRHRKKLSPKLLQKCLPNLPGGRRTGPQGLSEDPKQVSQRRDKSWGGAGREWPVLECAQEAWEAEATRGQTVTSFPQTKQHFQALWNSVGDSYR